MILLLSFFSCDLESEIDKAFIEVSGRVTENGETVSGALVLLVSSGSISDGFSLSNGSITNNNGNYKIINVEAGEYYIVAVEDNNGNLQFDAQSDRLGFYSGSAMPSVSIMCGLNGAKEPNLRLSGKSC